MLRVSGSRCKAALLVSVVLATALFLGGCPISDTVPPDASFDGKPATGAPPLKVQFTDTSKPGTSPIVSWLWEFGDGTTSTERNPSHTYYESGSYTVSLTVTTVVQPASRVSVPNAVVLTEATTVMPVDAAGGAVEAQGARLVVPQNAFSKQVIVGMAANDGEVPVDTSSGERLVSTIYGIQHDQDDLFVDVRAPMYLEIPFISKMVPAVDRNGAKIQIIARQENGLTIPILGEVVGSMLVASLSGLPHRASYGVVYRPGFVIENIPVDDIVFKSAKNATGYVWQGESWRIGYTNDTLQALTALRIGTLNTQEQYDRRDFGAPQLADTLSDVRSLVREVHNYYLLAGFMSPALLASPTKEFTIILHALNDPPSSSYAMATDVAFARSAYGAIVIDPAQLIAISKRNTVLTPIDLIQLGAFGSLPFSQDEIETAVLADRHQELDFSHAFAEELYRTIFRGYEFPKFTQLSALDLDSNGNARMIPYYQGFEDGIAAFLGQAAWLLHNTDTARPEDTKAQSLGFNMYSTFWEPLLSPYSHSIPGYSYATQDFVAYLFRRFDQDFGATPLPKTFAFIADSYEGVLELMRARESAPGVEDYADALAQSHIACDLAVQKTFNTTLADVYWDYVRSRAYENSDQGQLRPTDLIRQPFAFDEDRFNDATMTEHMFTRNNETYEFSYNTEPDLFRDVPPLSTRAMLLTAAGVSGDVTISVNSFAWVPDINGNSVRVKVYVDGQDGIELTPSRAQVTLKGLGASENFLRAVILLSNVTNDRFYDVLVSATIKAGAIEGPSGLLGGQVTDAYTAAVIPGVQVVVREVVSGVAGKTLGTTTTDSSGIYFFTQLPVGDVEVTFTKSGYATRKVSSTIVQGAAVIVSVALSPG